MDKHPGGAVVTTGVEWVDALIDDLHLMQQRHGHRCVGHVDPKGCARCAAWTTYDLTGCVPERKEPKP